MQPGTRFARWVFLIAGVLGILSVVPGYFTEQQVGRDYPPPVNHPEYYYGFFGVTLAWQFMFLLIGSDPIRYRPAMLPAMLEKVSFAVAIPVLYALERVSAIWLGFAVFDGTLLLLFIAAYVLTANDGTKP